MKSLVVAALLTAVGCAQKAVVHVSPASTGLLSGTVSYREQTALPTDAVVEVWITDVSEEALALPIVAEIAFLTDGRQVPLPFEVHYDPNRLDPARTYGARAVIRYNGAILFSSAMPTPVLTRGNPAQVDLVVAAADAAR
ncbi:MAG: YbaY family lipoprotein [Vicinamibacterales bacterium]